MSKTPKGDGLNNRFNSYQQGGPGSYIPPSSGGGGISGQAYAEQQTGVLADSISTQYKAEQTANQVLGQLSTQRQQLQGANEDVYDMREATENTKRELRELHSKYLAKKNRLYAIIVVLALTDLFLFLRILKCQGSFFCRHY